MRVWLDSLAKQNTFPTDSQDGHSIPHRIRRIRINLSGLNAVPHRIQRLRINPRIEAGSARRRLFRVASERTVLNTVSLELPCRAHTTDVVILCGARAGKRARNKSLLRLQVDLHDHARL